MVEGSSFAKTICSICYEDLKPVVEDLQVISICGHVFHELCLQQWFEYCSSKKKNSCPVCKQICLESSVSRLYFQSVGGPNDPILSQKPDDREKDPEVLCREVKRLEVQVSGLNSALECHGKTLKDINEELFISKEQAKKEATLKDEALSQKAILQRLLNLKSDELDRSTLDYSRLQERNMALAKELAALKLVSDLNLEEDEVLKLASLGNQANSKDTLDILKKSLVIRNKRYKELIEKCNMLGRGEARSLKKLEKAKEKINKMKARVQELETAIEVKDNDVLRALKASKKSNRKGDMLNDAACNSSVPSVNNKFPKDFTEQFAASKLNMDKNGSFTDDPFCVKRRDIYKDVRVDNTEKAFDLEEDGHFVIDVDDLEFPMAVRPAKSQTHEHVVAQNSSQFIPEVISDDREAPIHEPIPVDGLSGSKLSTKNNAGNAHAAVFNGDVRLVLDDVAHVQPVLQIRKENTSPIPLAQPGDQCFSAGILGPDGTTRYLGKWCRRIQGKEPIFLSGAVQEGSKTVNGDLIAVGADGRGGRIKVLRSLDQSLNGMENSALAKRCKYGAKTSSSQSQGCLQIEHFFGRAGR